MQSDPVKNVSLAGLLGAGGYTEGAKANKGAADNGAFTAEVRKLLAVAEAAGSDSAVKATAAGLNAVTEKAAAAGSNIAENNDYSDAIDLEKMLWFAKLRAPAESGGTAADGEEMPEEYAELPQKDKLRIGNELISHALKQIAAILGLPEDSDASAVFEFDPANIDQLAAIMAYLDLTIKVANDRIDVSANAESANLAMAAYGMESPTAHIEPEKNAAELSEFAAALRTEKFRLDMAFTLIGVSGMIAEKMAEQSDAGPVTGIPRAVNPADLSMPVADTMSAFSNLIKEELTASADRAKQTARGQADMTDLERAAAELGTVKSEILKAALSKANLASVATAVENDADANIAINKANVKTDAGAEAKADVKTGVDTANAKTDVNTTVNRDVKADVNTANVKTDVNVTVNRDVNADVINNNVKADINTAVKADVKADVNNNAKADVNTANVKADVNTTVNRNVKADIKTEANANAKTDADTADVKADIKTEAGANAKTDVNTADVKIDADTAVKADVKADVDANARGDVNRAEVKADVGTGVNKTIYTTNHTNRANNTNRREQKDVNADVDSKAESGVDNANVKAETKKVHADHTANVKTDANTVNVKAYADKEVNAAAETAAKADANKANVKTDVKAGAKTDVRADVKAEAKADVNTAAETDAVVRKRAADADLPISAHDSASRRVRSSVESANRLASMSAERATGANTSSSGAAEIPMSVMALAHGKKPSAKSAEGEAKTAEPQTQAKNTLADGETADLPVSVTESFGKKQAAKSVIGAKSVKEAAKAVAAAAASAKETESANKSADAALVAKLKQTAEAGALVKGIGKASADSAAKSAKTAASDKTAVSSAGKNESSNVSINAADSDADLSADSGDESESNGAAPVGPASSRSADSAKNTEKADASALSQNERFEVIRQISEKLNNAVRSGANEVRLILRPEALGEVRMSIRIQGDVVFARMRVESKQVKAVVESNLQSLKDSLNRQNLEFGAIDVEVGAQSEGGKSPGELWQEMADRSESSRGFRPGVAVNSDGTPIDSASDGFVSLGSDTGRRFGDNTFEYFA